MTHPILNASAGIASALKEVATVSPVFMTGDEKSAALRELTELESRLSELKLRVLAHADDLADTNGTHDAAAWLSRSTRTRLSEARADRRLGRALDRDHPILADALRDGLANRAQVEVISRTISQLPDDVPADVRDRAEEALVGHCAEFDPTQLARIARHVLDVVAPEIAEVLEARRLEALEADARERTRLSMRRLGDGTTRISGLLPDVTATRLATYLEAFTNPRKHEPTPAEDRLPYPRRLGEAFAQFLEAVEPNRLPLHGGDATTVVVTISLDSLRDQLSVGTLATTVPGDELTGDQITATEARRLACSAQIIPAVLGGAGEVLDVGRAQRLFTRAQRRALLLRDHTCRAEACDIPGTWSEAHHWIPWHSGGPTDLANAVLLCHHHHQVAHDPAFDHSRLSNGDVRFSRRT